METIFVRSQYNYDRDLASKESALHCKDKSLTVQSSLEESDINTIVKRFNLTGQLPDNLRVPQYGDFSEITDYHTALNRVAAANEEFDKLPATLRARFQNDTGAFVDFCLDPKNEKELIELGLASKRVETPSPGDTPAPPNVDTPPPKG
jgi:phage internal scaffolding protein